MAVVSPVHDLIERLYERHRGNGDGAPAGYIPELARADPSLFGICLATTGGALYEIGDTRQEFTIQSISKPLTYALALETLGEAKVRRHVDVEPSGEAFNSITLQAGTGIPLNPMVNAGAITTTSLIEPGEGEAPIDVILREYSEFAGRRLTVDEEVFASENETGHRNRAIAYLLKNSDVLADEVEAAVETYFRQCSTRVDCRDLAVIAATLAGNGVNPLTGNRVLREDTVRSVLSVMASCGMYDAAGDWMYHVGLPAKSGVAGGIIAVLPGQVGIAVFSPPLDAHGNSVRGVKVCEDLSNQLHLHVMSPPRRPAPPIRARHTCVASRSRRMRPEPEQEILTAHGGEARVFELQGEVTFAASELIVGAVLEEGGDGAYVVLDFAAVRAVDETVLPIFSDLAGALAAAGGSLLLSAIDDHPELAAAVSAATAATASTAPTFATLDLALEWAEDRILEKHGAGGEREELPLAEHAALAGMDRDQLERLAGVLERRVYPAGAAIYDSEDVDVDEMLLIAQGKISILNGAPPGPASADPSPGHAAAHGSGAHRLATISPGMSLGEVAMLSGKSRIGISMADTEVVAYSLGQADLDRLRAEDPALVAIFFENLLRLYALRAAHLRRNL